VSARELGDQLAWHPLFVRHLCLSAWPFGVQASNLVSR
jgi:hypothetical protein